MVKPTHGGSALGVSVVRSEADLPPAMVSAFVYGDTAMIQRFVTETEVAVSVIDTPNGPTALPPVEIIPESGMYDYHARYTAGATEFLCPARVAEDVAAAITDCALTAHAALRLSGLSRTDVVIDAEGTVWFLEVNVAPAMTETSLMQQDMAEADLAVGETVCLAYRRGPLVAGKMHWGSGQEINCQEVCSHLDSPLVQPLRLCQVVHHCKDERT